MENNQPVTPQEKPIIQPPTTPKKSNILILGLGAVALIGLGLLGGYLLFGNKPQPNAPTVQKVTQISPTAIPTPTTDVISEISEFPIYTGAIFVKREAMQPCTGNESGFSNCGSTTYTWQTPDDYMKVNSFYMSDTSQSGWKCSGGAGAIGGPRNATTRTSCKKGTNNYSLNLEANATETKIILAIPTQTQNNTSQTPQVNGASLANIKYSLPTGWKATLNIDSLVLAPTAGYLSIKVYDYIGTTGRREYYCQVSKVCIEETTKYTQMNIGNISGYVATGLDNSGGGSEYFGAKGNKFYIINSYNPPSPNDFENSYKQVLNSLVF